MNPIVEILKRQILSSEDFLKVSDFLNQDVEYLKKLKLDTVKEMIFFKFKKDNYSYNLTMRKIYELPTEDCDEYLKFTKIIKLPSSKIMSDSNKCKLALSLLTLDQLDIIHYICTALSCSFNASGQLDNPQVFLLDSPGGTGKSYLIDCLALCTRTLKICIIARNATLLSKISTIKELLFKSCTICSFLMSYFDLSYKEAITAFDGCDDVDSVIAKVKGMIEKLKSLEFDLLIVDEYSLESPLLLLLLVVLAQQKRINLLMMGDVKQQNTLSPSKLHRGNNYELLLEIPSIKQYAMKQQMRIKDSALLQVIDKMRTYIEQEKDVNGNTLNTFHLKYSVFTQLKSKFLVKSNLLKDVYLTDFHKDIKNRMIQMKEVAEQKNVKFIEAPYMLMNKKDSTMKPLILPKDAKFLPYLLLVEGCTYLHKKQFVKITKIHDNYIACTSEASNTPMTIKKIFWDSRNHECSTMQFEWMCDHFDHADYYLLQYPLRSTIFTYHFIQGLTLSSQTLCIDLDSKFANSLYVGFSRVINLNQISAIQSTLFLSFLYTEYKNDEYYYKISNANKKLLEHLCNYTKNKHYKFDDSFVTVQNVDRNTFERVKNKKPIRVERRLYGKLKRDWKKEEISNRSSLSILLKLMLEHKTCDVAHQYHDQYQ